MTCKEFRQLNASESPFRKQDVRQRALGLKHYQDCAGCQFWLDMLDADGTMSEDEVKAQKARDLADPKWREIMGL